MENEIWIRLGFSIGTLILLALLESHVPRLARVRTRLERWPANISITVLSSLLVRLASFATAVAASAYAQSQGIGLLHLSAAPVWVNVVVSLVVLDLAVYGQHVAFHYVPWLWRVHRIHHADPDLDVTTGLRFHPIEIVLSQIIKAAVVLALGALPVAVIVFEILLNATTLFNHANLRLSPRIDRIVRLIIVTPDMHRVHHSVLSRECNSNFGFNLAFWDRLFGTYRAQPEAGHIGMTIGLKNYPGRTAVGLWWLLANPFAKS